MTQVYLILIMKSNLWHRLPEIYYNIAIVGCWFSQGPSSLEKSWQLLGRRVFNFLLKGSCPWKDSPVQWVMSKGDHYPGAWNSKASFSMKHLWNHLKKVSLPLTSLCTLSMCNIDSLSYPSLPPCFRNTLIY